MAETSWETRAATKRAAELAKIPPEWRLSPDYLIGDETSDINVMNVPAACGILTPVEIEITEKFSAVSLAKAVQSGSLTASAVAVAFCKRAAIAQQLTNCLTETFFPDAIERGKYLDNYLATHQRPVGPLHGVPISLKDPFNYVGVASTLGLISYLHHPVADKNSPLVDILLELGAILYCKTNIPQTLMSGDSENNVFGRTLNPHRLSLGAGGSSGGEGALVAMRGSILGVGTDIGGSIRIPSLCCGIYGFKPSGNRIPYGGGAFCSRRGSPGFPPVAGPMANSFEDLAFFAQNVIKMKPWDRDASAIAFPWRSEVANLAPPGLRVGYFAGDSAFPIHPPVARALDMAAKKLATAGMTIIPLAEVPSLETAAELSWDTFSLDNHKTWKKHLAAGGEPIIASITKYMFTVDKKPETGYTLDDVFDLNVAKAEYKAAWNKIWVDNKLDVLLCPGAQNTAVPHDNYGAPAYTVVWNLTEYPGLIIPVGTADSAIDRNELATVDPNRPYQAEVVHGAPTVVQLVARSYHDEELIAAGRAIDQILRQMA